MSREPSSTKSAAADRQKTRAMAVTAAAMLATASQPQAPVSEEKAVSTVKLCAATQWWTRELLHFIENGRWSHDLLK